MVSFLKDLFKGYDGKLPIKKRRLSERSHLTIEFPQSDNRVIRTFIPFLENPSISEKGKANLNSYNLVGRAGQLFSYGGAESRKLTVNFNITLLHVMEEEKDLAEMFKSQFKLFFSEAERAREAFGLSQISVEDVEKYEEWENTGQSFVDEDDGGFSGDDMFGSLGDQATARATDSVVGKGGHTETGVQRDHAALHRDYYRKLIKHVADFDPNSLIGAETINNFFEGGLGINSPDDNVTALNSTINLVYLWVNLIRASILNNSRSTTLGPPIVRLSHGGMYNNVPCLLQDYSINIVEQAGYDVQTMTPKRLEISLNLIESRTGNFREFKAGEIAFGDNLTGWESVIETNNIDPYNGVVGGEGEFGVEV